MDAVRFQAQQYFALSRTSTLGGTGFLLSTFSHRWILKPACSQRGEGIEVFRSYVHILEHTARARARTEWGVWICQKSTRIPRNPSHLD